MTNNNKKAILGSRSMAQVLKDAKRRTLIESTGSSLRLAGVKVSNKDVEQIVNLSILNSIFKENIERLLTQKQLAVWDYLQKVAVPRRARFPNRRRSLIRLSGRQSIN